MGKTLIIVESAGKVGKIKNVLGSNYEVMPSFGHIIDLDKKSLSIKIDENFEPIYTVIKDKYNDKNDIISKMRNQYNKCDDILIATDPDREGEMIAWSIAKELGIKNAKRIKFYSLDKPTILKGVQDVQKIDDKLVDAQKMRRLLDRLVGFKLSPILWKNMRDPTLSAGRVQSVVLKLIVEKELEIKKFLEENAEKWFKISGEFQLDNSNSNSKDKIKAILYQSKKEEKQINDDESDEELTFKGCKITKESKAEKIMNLISESKFKIGDIIKKESIRKSSAPFETSTLQQEASNKLGFTSSRTMNSAQNLYNAGLITYMRTDSISLSKEAHKEVEKFILDKFGNKYYNKKEYKTKDVSAQEAHECIRPTDFTIQIIPSDDKKKIGSDEIKLYSLIWKRTIASQMTPAIFDVYTINIDINKTDEYFFITKTENIIFDGFLKVYNLENIEKEDVDTNQINNIPKKGLKLIPLDIIANQEYKNPPRRYNDASLVATLKKLGIGRPATYASFATKLIDKKYIIRGNYDGNQIDSIVFQWNGKDDVEKQTKTCYIGKENNKFIPSDIAILIVKFLEKKFKNIMSYSFTAEMEKQLDQISEGKLKWNNVLSDFYINFDHEVEKVLGEIKNGESIIDENSKYLGKHPTLGHKIYASIAKYGQIIKMIVPEGRDVTAPLRLPLTIDNVKLEDVISMLDWPKTLGKWERKNVILTNGKNGYWLKAGTESITLGHKDVITLINGKTVDIHDFSIEDAILLFNEKKKNILWSGKDDLYKYSAENGEYGNFFRVIDMKTKKKFNVSIPETENIKEMTIEKARTIVNAYKTYKPKFGRRKFNNYKKKN